MPNQQVIEEIESILSDVVLLGGNNENTKIVPNMLVRNATPTGLTDYIIIADDRDNDSILARKVPGIAYGDNDYVNVIFTRGGEAIAFQQASQSPSAGLWSVVPGTSTDILYDKGDVGIGAAPSAGVEFEMTRDQDSFTQLRILNNSDTANALTGFTIGTHITNDNQGWSAQIFPDNFNAFGGPSGMAMAGWANMRTDSMVNGFVLNASAAGSDIVFAAANTELMRADGGALAVSIGKVASAPDAALEIEKTSTQLRLTYDDASKFVDFSVDTNHDLTITPSSTGQIKLQPTTDSTDFFQVLDANGGTPILNVDSTNERVGVGMTPSYTLDVEGAFRVNNGIMHVPSTSWWQGNAAQGYRFNNAAATKNLFIIQDAGRVRIPNGDLEFTEITAPGAGAANTARLFARDNGATKTQLCVQLPSGLIVVLATDV